jgi:hypothetical protein
VFSAADFFFHFSDFGSGMSSSNGQRPGFGQRPKFQELFFFKFEWPKACSDVAKGNKILTKGLMAKGRNQMCSDTK